MAGEETKRVFDSGANRDTDAGKLDIEGFLSPVVLERYCEYLHKHRALPDGTLRDSDNWQKGIPKKVYVKSAIRHSLDIWCWWRGYDIVDRKTGHPLQIEDVICAAIFNWMGLLLELIHERHRAFITEVAVDGSQEFNVQHGGQLEGCKHPNDHIPPEERR